MGLILEILLALLIAGSIAALICTVRHLLRTPVPVSAQTRLFTVIAAQGDAESLEQTVGGLRWLADSGTLHTQVIITDCGLSPKGRQLAALLAKDHADLILCHPEQLSAVLDIRQP